MRAGAARLEPGALGSVRDSVPAVAPSPRLTHRRYWISPHDEVARSPKFVLALVADCVQCKACAALRRLPGPLSGKAAPHSLADDWSCSQNTWDPAVAYCNALCGNQPVSCRVDGVEVDAAIQDERAVKF